MGEITISKYKCFDGRVISSKEITHQHCSNIIWYNRILNQREIPWAEELLKTTYKGCLLPYIPDPRFTQEVGWLKDKGCVVGKDIIYNKEIIGRLMSLEEYKTKEEIIKEIKKEIGI
jgi:hypothetical protein